MDLYFRAWRPDVGGPNTGFAARVEGAVPQAVAGGLGYGPFPQLSVASGAEALPDTALNIISIQLPTGSWAVYAVTATAIYELQSDATWADIETGRTSVTLGASMCLYGKYLINSDVTNGMKAYDVSAGGTNDPVSGAPAARSVFTMNNVLFALGTSASPRRFQSSDLGQFDGWSGGLADGKTFEDGGALICGTGLKNGYGLMFQEHAVRAVIFGEGAGAYAISKVADGIGCAGEMTLTAFDDTCWWWDASGPWELTAGSKPMPIGAEKIERWAVSNIGRDNYGMLQGAVDPQRKLVLWRVDESRILAYSWLMKEWTLLPSTTAALARIAIPATSINALSGTIDALDGTIDDLGGGAAPLLGGLNSARKFSTYTGPNRAATLETCAVMSGSTGLGQWATPVDDTGDGTVQIGVSDRPDSALAWKPAKAKVASGRVEIRGRGKLIALRRNIPSGSSWTYTSGFSDIQFGQGGPK